MVADGPDDEADVADAALDATDAAPPRGGGTDATRDASRGGARDVPRDDAPRGGGDDAPSDRRDDTPGSGRDAPSDGRDDPEAAATVAVRRPAHLAERLAEHVDEDEPVRLWWTVRRQSGPDPSADEEGAHAERTRATGEEPTSSASGRWTVYAVTDRRLLAVEAGGRVRETPFGERSGGDPTLALAAGATVAVLSFLGGVAAASGWTALLLVVTCAGGLALAERGWKRWRAVETPVEREETAVVAAGVAGASPGDVAGAADVGAEWTDDGADASAAGVAALEAAGLPLSSAVDGEGSVVAGEASSDGDVAADGELSSDDD